jgi:hypothetical protein
MCILWTPVAVILCIYVSLQVKPRFIKKNINCRLISPSTTECRNQLQKWTLLAGSHGCKVCVHYCCFMGSELQQLCCPSCTRLWHSSLLSFSDFLGVRSSLAPMSSTFSSVSTRCLCFCFLSIKSLVDLSLFTKLWILCLLETLSSQSLHQNFCRHFLLGLYFTQLSYRNTHCSEVYRPMM